MDVTNLILYLKSKITSESIDQQMVSKVIRLLELGAVFTANSFSALPSAVGRSGELWYVLYDGLYWSTGELWLPLVQTSQSLIWAWGANSQGSAGDNTTTNRSSPVSVVGGLTDWCQASAGAFHSLAIRSNGTTWAWGNNGQGRLGDNTTTSRSSPVSVVGGFMDWCQAAGGNAQSLAVRSAGSAWSWGANYCGSLGDNTTTSRSSPVSVTGGFSDWCQVKAGYRHSLGVRSSGSAWAWGCNGQGRLGDNTTTNRSSPVSVVGGFSDWCQASAGVFHSLALRQNGTTWAWGQNNNGQLGDNTATSRSSPVSVVGGFSDWCQASAGGYHSLALRTGGSAWVWGQSQAGQLGNNNTTTNRSSPVSVVGGFSDWCQANAGCFHSLAVRTGGSAWSWGCNNDGRLGEGTTINRSSPVSVAGSDAYDWFQVSGGSTISIALRSKTL